MEKIKFERHCPEKNWEALPRYKNNFERPYRGGGVIYTEGVPGKKKLISKISCPPDH